MFKKCTVCEKNKPLTSEFFPYSHGFLSCPCRKCVAAKAKAYRERNPKKVAAAKVLCRKNKPEVYRALNKKWADANKEKIAEKNAEWYKNRPESSKEKTKEWAKANPDKLAIACRKWRAAHPDRQAASSRNWELAHPELRRMYNMNRVAAKLQATPIWITAEDSEIMELIYTEADHRDLHVDHMVPLRGENVCGLHVYWNTQLLNPKENGVKSNKWPYEPRISF